MLTYEERVARFETMRLEGRLLRRAWTETEADGRERACWLAALSPEAGAAEHARACPADVMPAWLAYLTPRLDDWVSADRWDEFAERFGRCAAGWPALDDAAWSRVEVEVKLAALAIAREAVSADAWGVLPALDEVARLLREGGSKEEWADARFAADDAARVAAYAAAHGAAAHAAYAAAHAATVYAETAARSTAYAASAARASRASRADFATHNDVHDRIAAALFDAIDREIASTTTRALETPDEPSAP